MSKFPIPDEAYRPPNVMARVDFIGTEFDPIDLHNAWRVANSNRLLPNKESCTEYEMMMLKSR